MFINSLTSLDQNESFMKNKYRYTEVYYWGNDKYRHIELINEKQNENNHPIPKLWNLNFIIDHISCGEEHIAFLSNGNIYTMGNNTDGRLGIGKRHLKYSNSPCLVQSLERFKIIKIACGAKHCVAITDSGEIFTWGYGEDGQLGLGNLLSQYSPQKCILMMEGEFGLKKDYIGAKELSCGASHTAVISDAGEVFTWGANDQGQLGTGKSANDSLPSKVKNFNEPIQQICCASNHTLFLSCTGKVYGCGSNTTNQLALKEKKIFYYPVKINGLDQVNVIKIAAGYHSAAISDIGDLYIWGNTLLGDFPSPKIVHTDAQNPIMDIKFGKDFTIILDNQKTLWGFGKNAFGELGNGDFEQKNTITKINTLYNKRINDLACGKNFVIALGNIVDEESSKIVDQSEYSFQKSQENVEEIELEIPKANIYKENDYIPSDEIDEEDNEDNEDEENTDYNNILYMNEKSPKSPKNNCSLGKFSDEDKSKQSLNESSLGEKKTQKKKRRYYYTQMDAWEDVKNFSGKHGNNNYPLNQLVLREKNTNIDLRNSKKSRKKLKNERDTVYGGVSKKYAENESLLYEYNEKSIVNDNFEQSLNYSMTDLKNFVADMKILQIQNNLLTNQLEAKSKQIHKLENKIKNLHKLIEKSYNNRSLPTTVEIMNDIVEKDKRITEFQVEIDKLKEDNKRQKQQLNIKDDEIMEKNKQIENFLKEIENFKIIIHNTQDERKNLNELCRIYQQLKVKDAEYIKKLQGILKNNIIKKSSVTNQSVDLYKNDYKRFYEDQIKNLAEILGIDLKPNDFSPALSQASSGIFSDKRTINEINTELSNSKKLMKNIIQNDFLAASRSSPDEYIFSATISPTITNRNHHKRVASYQVEVTDPIKDNILKKKTCNNLLSTYIKRDPSQLTSSKSNIFQNISRPYKPLSQLKYIPQSNTPKNCTLDEQQCYSSKKIKENFKPSKNCKKGKDNNNNNVLRTSLNNQENFHKFSGIKFNNDMKKSSNPSIETLPLEENIKQTKKNIENYLIKQKVNQDTKSSFGKSRHSYSNSISFQSQYPKCKSILDSGKKKETELSPRIESITTFSQGKKLEVHQLYNKLLSLLNSNEQ